MIDHVALRASDLARSRAFYVKALLPLAMSILYEEDAYIGFGNTAPIFWIMPSNGKAATSGAHIAFAARSQEVVDEFYGAALAAGGHDNGAPGLRPEYEEGYYAAFILDPDGNNIEVVCHLPVEEK